MFGILGRLGQGSEELQRLIRLFFVYPKGCSISIAVVVGLFLAVLSPHGILFLLLAIFCAYRGERLRKAGN